MKKVSFLPQGKYKIGKGMPEGIYLIAFANDYAFITIERAFDNCERYALTKEHPMCHVELEENDTIMLEGSAKVRHIPKSIYENEASDFNLMEEIADFQKFI